MKKMKRWLAVLLALCMVIGGIAIPEAAQASEQTATTMTLTSGEYSNSTYILWLKPTDNREIVEIGTSSSATVLVDGTSQTASWTACAPDKGYALTVPYTNQGTHYFTVKAGSTVGDVELSQDIYIKVIGAKMTGTVCHMEQVDRLPDTPYVYDTNYSSKTGSQNKPCVVYYFKFADGRSVTSVGWWGTKTSVYIDGVEKQADWYTDSTNSFYGVAIQYAHFGASSQDIGEHYIQFAKEGESVSVGSMTLTEEHSYMTQNLNMKQVSPTSVSLGATSGYHDENKQYVIRLTPEDGKTIITPGTSSTSVLIDGVKVENAISFWDQGSDNYGACIKYSTIESAAEEAADIGVHTITFPAGTYFGDRILTEDFSVCINGESQIVTSSRFSLADSGCQDGNPNNNYRYVFWLKPNDGREIVSLGSTSATILVDGQKVSNGVSWVDTSATSGYALAVNYSAIESDAVVSTDVGEHILTISKGTIVGDVAFAEDFMIKVNGGNISVYKPPITVSLASYSSYQDDPQYRYIFYLIPDDGREIVDLGSPSTTILVDGQEVSNGISWIKGSEAYGLCVKYDAIVSGATSYDQIGEHVLVVPAGTTVGDLELAEDLYIKINNGTITTDLTQITLQHTSTDAGTDNYEIWFAVEGATADLTDVTNSTIYVDGEKVSGITYTALNDTTGRSYGLTLPYDTVQSGATCWEDVTKPHLIKISKNTLFNGMVLKDDVEITVIGGTVTQVLEPNVTVTLAGHANNAISGKAGFYFTVTPEDELPYAADGTVEYHFIKNGVTVDGLGKDDATVKKLDAGLYYVDLSAYEVKRDTIVEIVGNIQTEDYAVSYTETYFQYKETSGWSVYIPPTNTDVYLENDTINGGENMKGIYLKATSDPLAAGIYESDDFYWDGVEDDDELPERHGGIHLNGEELMNVTLKKMYDGYYYIDLVNILDTIKADDVIKLEGTLFVDNNYVAYHPISFIRNKDGSFTQYDESAEPIPAETVALDTLYINIDDQATYTIPSTPLVTNSDVTVKVNNTETTDYTLDKEGIYKVERIMENTVLAEAISTVGDITYQQTIYMFETGDANLNASVSAADIINLKKNLGKTESAIGGASDLDYDETISTTDYTLLVDLLLEKKTAEEIIAADESIGVGAISDTHYLATDRDAQNRVNTRKALNYYKSQNVDLIIFNADITDLGEVGAYDELVADIKSVYPDEATRPKLVFTGDNHEWYDAWDGINGHEKQCEFEDVQARFCEELKELRENSTDTNTHYKVNGYHFIGVSSDNMNGGYSLYDDETVNWVETTLAAAAADDATGKKPIFLSIHQAPKNTVYGSDGSDHFDDSETKLTDTLAKYPQLVVITSHTHAPLQDERSIHQGNYTTLNTASLYYVGGVGSPENIGSTLMSTKYQFGQGLLIRTNKNKVDVERCDFYNDEKIKDNWVFETSDNASDYTKYTDTRANDREAPTFASDARIATQWNSDGTVTLTFDAATHKDFVHHYIVKVYKEGNTTPSEYVFTNFFFQGLSRMDETLEFTLSNLDATKNYTFEIQAVESWGKTSAAISSTSGAISDDEYFEEDFTPVVRFAVASDVHVADSDSEPEEERLEELFTTAYSYSEKQEYENLDGVFFAGDIVERGTVNSMRKFKNIVDSNSKNGTITRSVLGNHEFRADNSNTITNFKNVFGYETDDAHLTINGIHFLLLSQDEKDAFSTADTEWLEKELAIAAADDATGKKPIFVFQHEPNKGTTTSSSKTGNGVDNLYDIMKKYPQVVDFTGHTHAPLNDPRSIYQKDFTCVSTGGLSIYGLDIVNSDYKSVKANGYADGYEGTIDYSSYYPSKNQAQYWIVEVDANGAVLLKGYDITGKVFVVEYGLRSVSDTSKFKYTEDRAAESEAPIFDADAALTIVPQANKRRVNIQIPAATKKESVQNYRVELYQDGEYMDTTWALSGSFFHKTPDYVRASFSNLGSGEYTLKCYAVNSWGKESEPLLGSFTIEDVERENTVLDGEYSVIYDETALSSGSWYGSNRTVLDFGKTYAGETVTIQMDISGNATIPTDASYTGIRKFYDEGSSNQGLVNIQPEVISNEAGEWTTIRFNATLNYEGKLYLAAEGIHDKNDGIVSTEAHTVFMKNVTLLEDGVLYTTTDGDGWSENPVVLNFGSKYANKTVMAKMKICGTADPSWTASLGFLSASNAAMNENTMHISVDRTKLMSTEWSEIAIALPLNENGQIYLAASRTNNNGESGVFTAMIKDAEVIEEIEDYYSYDYAVSNGGWSGTQKAMEFGSEYANKLVHVTLTVCGNADPNKTTNIGMYGYSYEGGTYKGSGIKYPISREQASDYQNWSTVDYIWQLDENGSFMTSAAIATSEYENYTLFIKNVEAEILPEHEYYTYTTAWSGEFFTLDFSEDEDVSAYDTIELQLDVYGVILKEGTASLGFYYNKTTSGTDDSYGNAVVYKNSDLNAAIRSGEWSTVTVPVKLDANKKVKLSASRTENSGTDSTFALLIKNVTRK